MPEETFETPRFKLAEGVASGLSLRQAAERAGVKGTTARRIAQKSDFKALVAALAASYVERAARSYSLLCLKAAARLDKLLDSANEEIALRAAKTVIADYVSLREHLNITARLDDLAVRFTELERRAGVDPTVNGHDQGDGGGRL
jgi:hypothetical protein